MGATDTSIRRARHAHGAVARWRQTLLHRAGSFRHGQLQLRRPAVASGADRDAAGRRVACATAYRRAGTGPGLTGPTCSRHVTNAWRPSRRRFVSRVRSSAFCWARAVWPSASARTGRAGWFSKPANPTPCRLWRPGRRAPSVSMPHLLICQWTGTLSARSGGPRARTSATPTSPPWCDPPLRPDCNNASAFAASGCWNSARADGQPGAVCPRNLSRRCMRPLKIRTTAANDAPAPWAKPVACLSIQRLCL